MSIDLSMQLSANFQLSEFIHSDKANALGIDNTPTDEIVGWLKVLCKTILQPARDALGPLVISSGYRCPALNRAVGGSDTSGHKLGFCADVLPVKVGKLAFAKWVTQNAPFDQVILEFGDIKEPAWIHVSCDPRRRSQILRILNGGTYEPVSLG